jgi:hypothetical protein
MMLEWLARPTLPYASARLLLASLCAAAKAVGPFEDRAWADEALGLVRVATSRVLRYNGRRQQQALYTGAHLHTGFEKRGR